MSKVSSYFKTLLRTTSKNSSSSSASAAVKTSLPDGNADNSEITLQIGPDTMQDETSIFFEAENTDFNYEMRYSVMKYLNASTDYRYPYNYKGMCI